MECQKCRNCHIEQPGPRYYCRKYAPQPESVFGSKKTTLRPVWPLVDFDDWCAEYEYDDSREEEDD